MAHGRIKEYDPEDGNGYIAADGSGDEVPFSRDDLAEGETDDLLRAGDRVTYEVEGGLAGIHAFDVRRVGAA